jgi:hypothetical protein
VGSQFGFRTGIATVQKFLYENSFYSLDFEIGSIVLKANGNYYYI